MTYFCQFRSFVLSVSCWVILVVMPFAVYSVDASMIEYSTQPDRNTITVTSRADSGAGSLRQALLNAQAGDTIRFEPVVFPPSSPMTITILSALPQIIQGNLTVDGSNAGVILDGFNAPSGASGLYVTSNNNVIKGLQIVRFKGDGIGLTNGASGNQIGGDWQVGSAPRGEGNILTLNGEDGIDISGADSMNNRVTGNLIGLDRNGTLDLRFQVVALSPAFAQDGLVLAGSQLHGAWRSTDGGAHWQTANTGLSILNVMALAFSPGFASDRTLFVGTGEGGIFKSISAGATWLRVGEGILKRHITAVVVSPAYATDHQVWAGSADEGIATSTDEGATWTLRNNGITDLAIHDIALSPDYAHDRTVFVLSWKGLFKSTDGGQSWRQVSVSAMQELHRVVLSPGYASDHTLFVGTRGCQAEGVVWKSSDGGLTWSAVGGNPGWCHARALAIAPNFPASPELLVGDDWGGVYRSMDGGASWLRVHESRFSWAVAYSPAFAQDQTMFVGQLTGLIWRSNDRGNNWQNVTVGLSEQGNYYTGVNIHSGAHDNVVGGIGPGLRNVIGRNGTLGIQIEGVGSDHNQIVGNYLGTAIDGMTPLGNGSEAIGIRGGARGNRVGGPSASQRNIISGNRLTGLLISGQGTAANVIQGNFVGLAPDGIRALGNDGTGIVVDEGSASNQIGGTAAAERNIISANGGNGIGAWINVKDNIIIGNFIGTDASGTVARGNYYQGIVLGGAAQNNRIGGSTAGERNVISGNGGNGIGVWEDSNGNTIAGNFIGVSANGDSALSNLSAGITISMGAHDNCVGGSAPGERNVISGNADAGIVLGNATTTNNTMTGNYLGADATGMRTIGNGHGIRCEDEAHDNAISHNLIVGNTYDGILLQTCDRFRIEDNMIGTDASGAYDVGNARDGIELVQGAEQNTVGPGNVIAYNRARGVNVRDATTVRNRITQNTIYANMIMGIDAGQGGNTEPSPPVITAVTTNSVTGIAPFANARVEVFSDEGSQGRVYEGFVMAGADGRFAFSTPGGVSGPFLTATATDGDGNTSKFAAAVAKPRQAGADAFETDDACAQARQALTDGTVQAHTFHQAGDTDWVRFQATAGSEYLIEGQVPVSSPTDLQAELYDQCNGVVRAAQDHAFAAGIRIRYQAPLSGPLFLRLVNHSPSVFGAHVAYNLSVRVLSRTPTPGALIIVAGRLRESDALQTNIHHVSHAVRTAFLNQGYDDSRVYYLATNLGLPGVDAAATKANLRTAITAWAFDKVGPDRALTLYLVDHGAYDRFYLDAPRGEWVAPDEVDQWLTQLETARPGVRVNVIIEACYSGSFIDPPHRLSKPGRVVIASTTNNDLAWSSDDGAVFSDHFIEAISQQQSLFTSFQTSRWAARQAHFLQDPWLDDNGDGVYNELQDGAEAARRGFAYAGTFSDLWPPYIVEASGAVNAGNTTGVIRARVLDDVSVRSVWAIIYPPSYQPPPPGSTWGQDILPTLRLLPQDNDWFAASYPGFTEPGSYRIVIYADDHTDLDAQPQAVSVRTGPHSYLPWVQ